MIYILIYLAGVLAAWFCIAWVNDVFPKNNDSWAWAIFSWGIVAATPLMFIVAYFLFKKPIKFTIPNNIKKPTLTIFKRKKKEK